MVSSRRRARRRPASVGAACLALGVLGALAPASGTGATPATASLQLLSGGLSLSAPAALEMPPVRLVGAAVTVEKPLATLTVSDTRPGSQGWTVVITATPLADALGRPLGATLTLLSPPAAAGVTPGPGGDLDEPRAVATAAPGGGGASVSLTPGLRLRVPGDAPSGRYTAEVVVTAT